MTPINPTSATHSVSQILKNNPDLAKHVMNILIHAESPGWKDSNDYDDIKDMCWLKTEECRDARDRYLAARAAEILIAVSPFVLLTF